MVSVMENLVNFRDLGGYQNREGKKVVSGKVLRSAQPVGLAEADKNILVNNYQLKKIIEVKDAQLRATLDAPRTRGELVDRLRRGKF